MGGQQTPRRQGGQGGGRQAVSGPPGVRVDGGSGQHRDLDGAVGRGARGWQARAVPATVRMLFLLAPFVPSRALRGRRCSQLHYTDEETEARKRDLATGCTAGQGRIRDLNPDRGESQVETSAGRPGAAVDSGEHRAGPRRSCPPGAARGGGRFYPCLHARLRGGAAVRQGSWVTSPPPAEWPEAAGTGNGHGGQQTSAPAPRPGARQETPSALFRGNRWRFFPGLPEARQMVPGLRPRSSGEGGDPSSRCVRHFDRTRRFHKYLRKPERRGAARGAGRWLRLSDACAAPSRGEGEARARGRGVRSPA